MLCEDRDEAIAVRGLYEMDHLMDDDVFEKVFGRFTSSVLSRITRRTNTSLARTVS